MKLIVSHVTRPKTGEVANGDSLVVRVSDTHSLLAVVDALGYGPPAAEAAERAVRYLEAVDVAQDVRAIMSGLHSELRHSRGAAAMICRITQSGRSAHVEGCGVGNVELRTSSSSLPVVLSPGILGGSVRQFRVFHGELPTRLVFFSDGISARFAIDSLRRLTPQEACARLMSEHGRSHDDATVLIADCEN